MNNHTYKISYWQELPYLLKDLAPFFDVKQVSSSHEKINDNDLCLVIKIWQKINNTFFGKYLYFPKNSNSPKCYKILTMKRM